MIRVYRYPEGISLNGKEYLLNEDNSIMLFDDEPQAKAFLIEKGFSEEDFDDSIHFEEDED